VSCVICGAPAVDDHHVIPKGRTNKKNPAPWCEDKRNKALLCRACHLKAHTRPGRVNLIHLLAARRPHLDYNEEPWGWYLSLPIREGWYGVHSDLIGTIL